MTIHVKLRQPLLRIQTDTKLPDRVDVAIIGAGIVGVSAAYFLAKQGLSVAVLEKGIVGAEQSSRNWGWCRQQGRDLKELALMKRSIALWHNLQKETGRDLGFRECGSLFITNDFAQIERWSEWQRAAEGHEIKSELLDASEARLRMPGYVGQCVGGLATASDGFAEADRAAPMLAEAARELGVKIVQNCAVRLLDIEGGRIVGVITELGRLAAQTVICAGGAWSGKLLRRHGISLPQGHVHGSAVATRSRPGDMVSCTSTLTVSTRVRADGGLTVGMNGRGTVYLTPSLLRHATRFVPIYRARRKWLKVRLAPSFLREMKEKSWNEFDISPFEHTRILDPGPDMELIARALQDLAIAYPEMKGAVTTYAWGGVIDSLPDLLPVISPVDRMPGLFLSTGFSGHGFGIAPAAGELMATLVMGNRPHVDIAPFRYNRLIDGSKLRPGGM